MIITVRLFAVLREDAGLSEIAVDLRAGATVADVRAELLGRYPSLANLVSRVAYAVNRDYAPIETMLKDGDEVALIPPVSGGT